MATTLHLTAHHLTEAKAMFAMMREVFEEPSATESPSDEYLQNLLGKKSFYALAALEGKKVVGGLTAYQLDGYQTTDSQLMVYDLAVAGNFQRKGIGTLLMKTIFQIAKDENIAQVFVQAEDEDKHAIAFYQSLKPSEYLVAHHFNFIIGAVL